MAGFDGSFTIPSPYGEGPWILSANHRDFAYAHMEVKPGQTGIALTLEKGWEVNGTITWDEDLDLEQCRVELMPTPDLRPIMDMSGRDFPSRGEYWELDRIESGTYALEVSGNWGGSVLHRQELKLEGEGGHLAIGTIDLTDKLTQTTFTLAPEVEEEDWELIVVDHDGWVVKADQGRSITAVYPKRTEKLALWVEGQRTLLLDDLSASMEVRPEPGIPIAIDFDPVGGFPEDVFMITELSRVEDPEGGPELPGYLTRRVLPSVGMEIHVPAAGHYRVMVLLGLVPEGSPAGPTGAMTYVTLPADAPVIEVKEGTTLQAIHVPFEDQVLLDAVERLRELGE